LRFQKFYTYSSGAPVIREQICQEALTVEEPPDLVLASKAPVVEQLIFGPPKICHRGLWWPAEAVAEEQDLVPAADQEERSWL
jgi:hypothetical protein